MVPSHLIRLLPDGAAEWLALSRDGRVLAGPQAGFPNEPAERVDVLVPAADVLLLRAPRVARQRRQLELAVPFAIEEQLAAPVEQLHVALADDQGGEDDVGVAVVARASLEAWLAQLRAAGIEPDRLTPESALMPCSTGTAAVLVEGDRAILRHAEHGAFAGDTTELPGWLDLLAADGRAPTRLRWIGAATGDVSGIAIEPDVLGEPLRWFAAQPARARAINLLQGRYAPRRGREGARRLWRWAAVLAAAAVLAGFAQLLIEQRQLVRRHAEQRQEMEQLLRSAVPDITRIVDAKKQLATEFALLGRGSDNGVLPLLARIAPTISGSGRYTLDGIEYRGGSLELVVRAEDVAALDSLRETLAALSLQVELTSANPGSGGVEGRLRIRGGGA